MFDLVIKDAEIFDGDGNAPVRGDVGVTAGKITEVGSKLGAAKKTVNADGLALAPGIIDGHTHYDAQITWDPFVDPSPALGVHRGAGQLRLHHRALQAGRPRPHHAQPHPCRGHVARRVALRHPLGV